VKLSFRARGSSMQRRDELYLADIVEAADAIRSFPPVPYSICARDDGLLTGCKKRPLDND